MSFRLIHVCLYIYIYIHTDTPSVPESLHGDRSSWLKVQKDNRDRLFWFKVQEDNRDCSFWLKVQEDNRDRSFWLKVQEDNGASSKLAPAKIAEANPEAFRLEFHQGLAVKF